MTQRSVVQIHPPQPFTDLRDYRRSPQFQNHRIVAVSGLKFFRETSFALFFSCFSLAREFFGRFRLPHHSPFWPFVQLLGLAHPQERVIGCEPISAVYCLTAGFHNSANSVSSLTKHSPGGVMYLRFCPTIRHKGKEQHEYEEYENDQESSYIDIAH